MTTRQQRNSDSRDRDFYFSICDKIGVLAKYDNGWTKEINYVKFGDRPPKFDIRDWDENHERMTKGVTLHREELEMLYQVLDEFLNADAAAGDESDDCDKA